MGVCVQGSPNWVDGGSPPTSQKFTYPPSHLEKSPLPPNKFLFPLHQKLIPPKKKKKKIFKL